VKNSGNLGGPDLSRRDLLRTSSVAAVSSAIGTLVGACSRSPAAIAAGEQSGPVKLTSLLAPTERESKGAETPLPPEDRVGFAIVGLGHLSIEQLLPAFGECKASRPVALVSGHRDKALAVANRYGIATKNIYDYQNFDKIKDNPAVSVVYIVLPNGMHAEYSIRASKAGKHVLCEKPMAVSVDECQRMIAAAKQADRLLMIAYRLQYEPHHRELIRMARAGELGKLKGFLSANGQNQGDPEQWRLKRALAGGGPLPDVGIYCINAARYLSGEEPLSVTATSFRTPNDPRFEEVEEQLDFTLSFPSGFMATCSSSYGYHNAKYMRLLGERGWAEMDPAFPYQGLRLVVSRKSDRAEQEERRQIDLGSKNHFALEMDHMAECVKNKKQPRTPGEEGLQDQRIITALYQAAESGRRVELPRIDQKDAFRGPPPT
jgi:predicted dehydrogenase